MLKKLKRKFILINMAFVGVVLLCVFATVCMSSYQSLKADVDHSLQQAVSQRAGSFDKPQIGGERGNLPKPKFAAVYAVLVDDSGAVVRALQADITMEESLLAQAVEAAYSADCKEGYLGGLGLYYRTQETPDGLKIAFADAAYVRDSMQRLLLASLLIGLCGMVAFFFISLFLSKWALRPVEKAWQQQRQFVADASHELKTPLTVILANNNILLSHPEETIREEKKWIDSTGEEAEHMRKLVDDLLFLAKSDAVGSTRVFTEIDLSELVWSVFLQFEPLAYEKEVSMDADIQSGEKVEGDPTQIKQLIHILLDNACKYAGVSGRVFLRLWTQGNSLLLSVENSGPPIPKEELPHLFERFYRSDKARSREGGFGLGLAIAKSIVDTHHGAISVESGEAGTKFTVQLTKR